MTRAALLGAVLVAGCGGGNVYTTVYVVAEGGDPEAAPASSGSSPEAAGSVAQDDGGPLEGVDAAAPASDTGPTATALDAGSSRTITCVVRGDAGGVGTYRCGKSGSSPLPFSGFSYWTVLDWYDASPEQRGGCTPGIEPLVACAVGARCMVFVGSYEYEGVCTP